MTVYVYVMALLDCELQIHVLSHTVAGPRVSPKLEVLELRLVGTVRRSSPAVTRDGPLLLDLSEKSLK